jgi:hypothetical protein
LHTRRQWHEVTDHGWRITKKWLDGSPVVVASREGRREAVSCPAFAQTHYDAFAAHLDGGPFPRVLADLADATRDIALVRRGCAG